MKRFFITIVVIVLVFPVVLGGVLFFNYRSTDEESVPAPTVLVLNTAITPSGYNWHVPIFGGMLYKDFQKDPADQPTDVGLLDGAQLTVETPEGYTSQVSILNGEESVWSGSPEELTDYVFIDNGEYLVEVSSERGPDSGRGYGSLAYQAKVTVEVEPRMEAGDTQVFQGDVLAIRVYNIVDGMEPTVETNIADVTFIPEGESVRTAYIPIAYDEEPGPHEVYVRVDNERWTVDFDVLPTTFTEQNLVIDTADEEISEANSAAAYQEYNDVVTPFFETTDGRQYWEGTFIRPVEGEITTEYGLYRFTNQSQTPSRHVGLDISADTGTPVVAPNAGMVVFAGYLLNTGNTLIIEHGGGLKSYFFHMDELYVGEGKRVEKGQEVGTVGSTGYSTGPHLHYEVRIGNKAISPESLFADSSGLYAFD